MCNISDKLKLCTCKTKNVEQLKHYWILKRRNGGNNYIVGQTMLPANIGEKQDRLNANNLQRLLNEGNCFDIKLLQEENDILKLHFTFYADREKYLMLPCHGNYLAYAFKFKKGKWNKKNYDPFGENLNNIQKGKIKNPFIVKHKST